MNMKTLLIVCLLCLATLAIAPAAPPRALDSMLAAARQLKSGHLEVDLRCEIVRGNEAWHGSQRTDVWFERPNKVVMLGQGTPLGGDAPQQLLLACDGRQLVKRLVDGRGGPAQHLAAPSGMDGVMHEAQSWDGSLPIAVLDPTPASLDEDFLLGMQAVDDSRGFGAQWRDEEHGASKVLHVTLEPATHLPQTYTVRMEGDGERMSVDLDMHWSPIDRPLPADFYRDYVDRTR